MNYKCEKCARKDGQTKQFNKAEKKKGFCEFCGKGDFENKPVPLMFVKNNLPNFLLRKGK